MKYMSICSFELKTVMFSNSPLLGTISKENTCQGK